MKIIITIPAYNEEKTLGPVLNEIKSEMDSSKYKGKYQILVLNDGSVDKTVEVAKKHGAFVYSHSRNKGLAETFKTEMKVCLEAGADVIVHTDADGQYVGADIPRLLDKLDDGYDLVIGSRFLGQLEGMPLTKRWGNIIFTWTLSKILNINLTDSTSGFRAFTKDVAKEIEFINSFTYTQEQIIRAKNQKFKIAEIPVYARKTRESRLFKSPLEYAIRAWINIFRIYRDYAPIKFFGSIGLILIAIGLYLGLYIIAHVLLFGNAGGEPRVILTALLILTGIQIMFFGFLADMKN